MIKPNAAIISMAVKKNSTRTYEITRNTKQVVKKISQGLRCLKETYIIRRNTEIKQDLCPLPHKALLYHINKSMNFILSRCQITVLVQFEIN